MRDWIEHILVYFGISIVMGMIYGTFDLPTITQSVLETSSTLIIFLFYYIYRRWEKLKNREWRKFAWVGIILFFILSSFTMLTASDNLRKTEKTPNNLNQQKKPVQIQEEKSRTKNETNFNITKVNVSNDTEKEDNKIWLPSLNKTTHSDRKVFFMFFSLNNSYYTWDYNKFNGTYKILFNASTPMQLNIMKSKKFKNYTSSGTVDYIQLSESGKDYNITRHLFGENMTVMVYNERGPSGYGKLKILNLSENATTTVEDLLGAE